MSSSSNPSSEISQEDDEVPKLVHQFYFVKLWPSSEHDSISQIKKQELTVEKMNRDIREITDKIKEKTLILLENGMETPRGAKREDTK
ncbi:hypothetical protein AHAS_Ahas18G0089900 [Arachis hypogaea]